MVIFNIFLRLLIFASPQCIKMQILLSYNKNENKILICNICLIKNENYETLNSIINYLKSNYQFEPKVMTVDFCKVAYKAFKSNYKIKEWSLVF